MDLASLSNEQLTQNLRSLLQPRSEPEAEHDRLETLVQELQVHRIELEMQNRALRETQEELEQAIHRYTDLYDHLPIGYVTLTASGQITQANLTAARWLQRDREQLTGLYVNWFLDAFDAGRFAAHLDLCASTKGAETCEVTLRLESGIMLTVQLASRATPVTPERPLEIHTAITDVSKVKQSRATVEEIAREQKTMNAVAAGQLEESFTTVSEQTRKLLHEQRSALAPEGAEALENIEGSALRMEATFQHLVDYCSLGREGFAHDPVNLDELVQLVLMEHRAAIESRAAWIDVARPLPGVRGSRLILAQVLANLLGNALRRPTEGRPLRIKISAATKPDKIVLTISDDGLRLPENGQSFRVFERLHGSRHFLADGVGFALVSRALASMHGRVRFDTDPNEGNRFHLELRRV